MGMRRRAVILAGGATVESRGALDTSGVTVSL